MKQGRLFKREKPTLLAKGKEADSSNVALARVILSDPVKYAGLQVERAKRVIAKADNRV